MSDERRHPFIEGLIQALPPEDAEWTLERRLVWLQCAALAFDLMYLNPDGSRIKIEIRRTETGKPGEQ